MRRLWWIFPIAFAVFMAPNFLRTGWESAAEAQVEDEPRIVAALFRSAWCGACRVLEPRVEDVRAEYEDAPIDWVRFDFTLGRRGGLREQAVEAGIESLYDELEGATGMLVLYDRRSGHALEIITMRYDRAQIRAALDRWLELIEEVEGEA